MLTYNEINKQISLAIIAARKKKGYTQAQLSLSLKHPVSYQQIGKYENTTNRVPIAQLYDIAQALDVHIVDLLPEMDNKIRFITNQITQELAESLTNLERKVNHA